MDAIDATEYLAECFWPSVSGADLRSLDQRIHEAVAQVIGEGESVRYLGSLLLTDDEVVFCRFEGSETVVRRVAQRAGIPFERIQRTRSQTVPPPPASSVPRDAKE